MCTEQGRLLERVRQRGLTMVELVVFIVVVSVGLAGILGVLNLTTLNSANPMLLKQQVAIAESLLEEIESKPFTWCDTDDDNVTTASAASVSTGGCAATVQGLSPTPGESRYSQTTPFDNVGDYNGFSMSGIRSPTDANTTINGLSAYSASVVVTQAGTAMGLTDNSAALRIDVTVGITGQPDITLTGYRYRYAPNVP